MGMAANRYTKKMPSALSVGAREEEEELGLEPAPGGPGSRNPTITNPSLR